MFTGFGLRLNKRYLDERDAEWLLRSRFFQFSIKRKIIDSPYLRRLPLVANVHHRCFLDAPLCLLSFNFRPWSPLRPYCLIRISHAPYLWLSIQLEVLPGNGFYSCLCALEADSPVNHEILQMGFNHFTGCWLCKPHKRIPTKVLNRRPTFRANFELPGCRYQRWLILRFLTSFLKVRRG